MASHTKFLTVPRPRSEKCATWASEHDQISASQVTGALQVLVGVLPTSNRDSPAPFLSLQSKSVAHYVDEPDLRSWLVTTGASW